MPTSPGSRQAEPLGDVLESVVDKDDLAYQRSKNEPSSLSIIPPKSDSVEPSIPVWVTTSETNSGDELKQSEHRSLVVKKEDVEEEEEVIDGSDDHRDNPTHEKTPNAHDDDDGDDESDKQLVDRQESEIVEEKSPIPSTNYLEAQSVAEAPVFQSLPSHFSNDFFSTRAHPWNRSGFRYQPCARLLKPKHSDELMTIEEHKDGGGIRDRENDGEEDEKASEELGHRMYYYRAIESPPIGLVRWSWEDRSSYVHITKDASTVTTDRGFRSARANVPIREGKWFFEINLKRAGREINQAGRPDPEEAHVRIGIARRESGLNAPVGIDGYSYGIRDKTGEKVHLSRLKPYGEPFGSGDVIGVLVELPELRPPRTGDRDDPARIERRRTPIRYRGRLYLESSEYPMAKEMEELAESCSPTKASKPPGGQQTLSSQPSPEINPLAKLDQKTQKSHSHSHADFYHAINGRLPVLKGSRLTFFKNGVNQGVAFEDLLDFLPLRVDRAKTVDRQTDEAEDPGPEQMPRLSNSSTGLHDDGTLGYYPCVSVYGGGIAQLNPGPTFRFLPSNQVDRTPDSIKPEAESVPDKLSWRPLSELYPMYLAEQRRLDDLDGLGNAEGEQEDEGEGREQQQIVVNKKPNSTKRKRPGSPNLSGVSPAVVGKGAGGRKKKIKFFGVRTSSPLSQTVNFNKPDENPMMTKIDEKEIINETSNVTPTPTTASSLSILCQVASASIGLGIPNVENEACSISQTVDVDEVEKMRMDCKEATKKISESNEDDIHQPIMVEDDRNQSNQVLSITGQVHQHVIKSNLLSVSEDHSILDLNASSSHHHDPSLCNRPA